MAFGSDKAFGTGGGTANEATIVLAPGSTVGNETGHLIVAAFACDNTATTDTDGGKVTGVTDSMGSVWTKAVEFTNGQGAVKAGAVISVWYAICAADYGGGASITATLSTTADNDATAGTAWVFTRDTAKVVEIEATNTLANDAASEVGSLNATTANIECLRIRAAAIEADDTTLNNTPTSTWTACSSISNGTGAAGMAVRMEFLISTATGAASTPDWTASGTPDSASVYVAFKELITAPRKMHSYRQRRI